MTPEIFAQAIVSIEKNYGLRLDALTAWIRLDAVQCGKGWVGTNPPGCKRRKNVTAGAIVKRPKTTIKMQDPGIKKYGVDRILGEGTNGRADLTDRGTVVKTVTNTDISLNDVRREFNGVKHIHSLGIGPEAIGIEGKKIEIGLVKGVRLGDIKGDTAWMDARMESAKTLLKLHKSGWSHNDAHEENIIVQSDGSVKLIDPGMAVPVGTKIGSDWDGDFHGRAGISDLNAAASRHPQVNRLREALSKDLQKHWDATRRSFGDMDNKDIYRIRQMAEIDLHKAYLAIADLYIK